MLVLGGQRYGFQFNRSGGTVDPDVTLYMNALTAAGYVPTPTVRTAYANFVASTKATGVWSLIAVLYPLIGGTAATHAINAKSPGTNNLTYGGTLTHDSNGMTGNGTTGYANTNFASNLMSNTSQSLWAYATAMETSGDHDLMGSYDGSEASLFDLATYAAYQSARIFRSGGIADTAQQTSGFASGMVLGSRLTNTDIKIYANGALAGSSTSPTSTVLSSLSLYLLALNFNNSATANSASNLRCAGFGPGLSSTQQGNLYTAVQALETALGRPA